jgi:hypothetical protein
MTNNKQQTAVEWLVEQFKEYDFADVKDEENYIIKMQSFVLTEKLEQAKEMHKEEIIQAWKKGDGQFDKVSNKMSLEYYKQTYGGGEQ